MTTTVDSTAKLKEFGINLIYGGVSGSFTKTIVAPLERIKIVLQVQDSSKQILPGQKYKGITDCAVRMYREQGFLSFWRGNWTNAVVRYFPTQAMGFAFDDKIRTMIIDKKVQYSKLDYVSRSLLCGAISGAISSTVVYPIDFARTRLSADTTEKGKQKLYKGPFDCIVKVVKSEGGIPAVYRGFMISIFGSVFYKGIYFGGYDAMKFLYRKEENQKLNFWEKWLIGQIVTTSAQYASYPYDTIRRRLMMRGGTGQDALYKNSFHCATVILKEEGFKGFFKGALANTFRGIGGALGLVMYDSFKEREK